MQPTAKNTIGAVKPKRARMSLEQTIPHKYRSETVKNSHEQQVLLLTDNAGTVRVSSQHDPIKRPDAK